MRHVAAACPAGLRLGTASWDFPGWAGFVYDTPYDKALLAREGLRAYARHPLMRAVSLEHFDDADMTPDTFRRVADQVPDDFRFVVKAPAVVTMPGGTSVAAPVDNPRYLDGDFARKRFVEPALAGLGEKCGPLLFHFPAQGRRVTRMARTFAVRLAAFLSALSPAPQCVVELLDPELWIDETLAALRDHGARPCLSLHPRAPSLDRQRAMLAGFPQDPEPSAGTSIRGCAMTRRDARSNPSTDSVPRILRTGEYWPISFVRRSRRAGLSRSSPTIVPRELRAPEVCSVWPGAPR
ncbi:MAG: DUF72 domain-containing protein [Burkholderiales bacterium]